MMKESKMLLVPTSRTPVTLFKASPFLLYIYALFSFFLCVSSFFSSLYNSVPLHSIFAGIISSLLLCLFPFFFVEEHEARFFALCVVHVFFFSALSIDCVLPYCLLHVPHLACILQGGCVLSLPFSLLLLFPPFLL
jgi:hypothetical protein